MESFIIRHSNGTLQNNMQCNYFWGGLFSTVSTHGELIKYILELLNSFNLEKITYIMPQSDGDISKEYIIPYINLDSKIIIGSVAQRFYDSNVNYLLLPQDDEIFQFGLRYFIWTELLPKWEDRIPKLFWRGSGSRRSGFLRKDVVLKLNGNSNTDVKFIHHWIYEDDNIPETCIGKNVQFLEFANYKMVLIVDGNGISSAHSWCFGIGAVPFMITNNDFWFKYLLIPFNNYIPIKYDLTDLEEKIEWVLEHDEEAKQIAERAYNLACTIFTPEFQKKYLENRIKEIIYNVD
jgi:hypothetical protein